MNIVTELISHIPDVSLKKIGIVLLVTSAPYLILFIAIYFTIECRGNKQTEIYDHNDKDK